MRQQCKLQGIQKALLVCSVASIHGDRQKPLYEDQARADALARSTNPAVSSYGGSWGEREMHRYDHKTMRGIRSMREG